MARTRSDYRLRLDEALPVPISLAPRRPEPGDRAMLASLLLDAYRGSVDDEGEGESEALDAIDRYLGLIDRDRSLVVEADGRPIAMCFVVEVEGLLYIDPIAVAPASKAKGLGGALVSTVLNGLRADGVAEVGAVITDGNVPSERLFGRLGFRRVGPWG